MKYFSASLLFSIMGILTVPALANSDLKSGQILCEENTGEGEDDMGIVGQYKITMDANGKILSMQLKRRENSGFSIENQILDTTNAVFKHEVIVDAAAKAVWNIPQVEQVSVLTSAGNTILIKINVENCTKREPPSCKNGIHLIA